MIILTLDILAVTKRLLCPGGNDTFLRQLKKIASSGVKAVILREKDLSPEDYETLARDVSALCAARNVQFIVHSHIQIARNLRCTYVHLPWTVFRKSVKIGAFEEFMENSGKIGISIHNQEEALFALEHGASYLIAGHVFPTQSKEGLEGRGLGFLTGICKLSPVPVYGIGGISEENISAVAKAGTAGVCLMSSMMQNPDPSATIGKLRQRTLDIKSPVKV